MSGGEAYGSWETNSFNNRWVFRLSSLGCRLLPKSALYTISDSLMDWFQGVRPGTLDAVEDNLTKAYPGRGRPEVEALSSGTFLSYGRGVVDYLKSEHHPPIVTPRDGAIRIIRSLQGGAVLVTAHMGNWEVGGAYLGEIVGPHWMVGFPEKDAGVEAFRRRKRGNSGHTTVSAGMGLEGMLRLRGILEKGGRMVVLVDRSVGRDSVAVTFLGRKSNFLRSPAVFSTLTGAPIVPVAIMRDGPGRYSAFVSEPYRTSDCGGRPEVAMQRAADYFSGILERYPDQWYNFFRYWREEP